MAAYPPLRHSKSGIDRYTHVARMNINTRIPRTRIDGVALLLSAPCRLQKQTSRDAPSRCRGVQRVQYALSSAGQPPRERLERKSCTRAVASAGPRTVAVICLSVGVTGPRCWDALANPWRTARATLRVRCWGRPVCRHTSMRAQHDRDPPVSTTHATHNSRISLTR